MESIIAELEQALDQLMVAYQEHYHALQQPLLLEGDERWQAPIYKEQTETGEIRWEPVRQPQPLNFAAVASALEIALHPSLQAFYGRWYSGDLQVTWRQHPLQLLQIHGDDDGERLQANLIGHVLMKQRLKQPITLFIGLADESEDLLVTLDNASGAVGLEFVGKPQHETLADNLAEFVAELQPR